jgi:hypothetical protein
VRLRKQLAEREKQNVFLRGYLEQLACLGNGDQYGNSIGNDIAIKALAATDDLSGCILCDAEPVGYFAYSEVGYGVAGIWEELVGPEYKGATPLYKAKDQKCS